MNTITIDCGASFIKSALFIDGTIKERLDVNTPSENKDNDIFFTGKIEDIILGVKNVIESFSKEGEEFNVCISNEMHGFLLADEKGNPYTGYISWQKEYGNIEIDGLKSTDILLKEYKKETEKTGMNVRAGLPSSNLLYLLRSGNLKEEKLLFYTLGEYIVKRIFGTDIVISPSNAAATGLYDLTTNDWNEKLKGLFDGKVIFPKIGEKEETVFRYNKKFRVFPAIGDYQAALLGAGIEREDDISFNLGTGAQVSVISDRIEFSDRHQVLPFFNGKYLYRIPHLPSGRALNVYVRFIRNILDSFNVKVEEKDLWKTLNESLNETSSNEMKCSMSFFENPVEKRTKGYIEDIGEYDLTLGNIIKLIFDKEVENFLWAADEIMEKEKVKRIVFSGGIARRIVYIREKIVNHYRNNVDIVEANDETLVGLNKYSLMKEEIK